MQSGSKISSPANGGASIGISRPAQLEGGFMAVAAGLGAEVVAEGPENKTQLAFPRASGRKYGRGYLFPPSHPAEELPPLVAEFGIVSALGRRAITSVRSPRARAG